MKPESYIPPYMLVAIIDDGIIVYVGGCRYGRYGSFVPILNSRSKKWTKIIVQFLKMDLRMIEKCRTCRTSLEDVGMCLPYPENRGGISSRA